MRYCNM